MKRRAVTLIEVLVAIFIMALGMMALLTLFPLGALRMAQAIQDDRTAACAASANAICAIKNIRNDPVVVYGSPKGADIFTADLGAGYGPPDANGPSNAVLVDPAGSRGTAGLPSQNWVGGTTGLLPRRDTSFTMTPIPASETYRWFTFLDDYEFDRGFTGTPGGVTAFPTTRDYIYSWTYLLQRPKTTDPGVVNTAVMVFKRRPLVLSGATTTLREHVYLTSGAIRQLFDTNRNVVTIDFSFPGGEAPPVRPGDWILDTSVGAAGGKRYGHANFYRIVSVTDISDTQVELEVQTPLRGFDSRFPQPAAGIFTGNVVVFDGLVEVFERGTGWK